MLAKLQKTNEQLEAELRDVERKNIVHINEMEQEKISHELEIKSMKLALEMYKAQSSKSEGNSN